MEFENVRVLVTGGASGIGAAVASLLSQRGARVAILDAKLPAPEASLIALTCDVTDDASVRRAVEAAADQLGGLDVVVNNAGIGAQGTVETNDDEEWRRVLDVNLLGIVRVSRAALPHLRRSDRAAIVNMCSVVATIGVPERALYSASKGAVYALTLAMAADHLREGIRVNCVSPGTADTPWIGRLLSTASDPAAERSALEARQPTGRLVTAEEVAVAAAFLASPLSGSSSGVNLTVDGGMSTLRLRPLERVPQVAAE